jgi:hypothetical protein
MGFDDGFTIEEESSSEIENIKTFTKSELEEKCMDLNGFVIPDNIMMKYYYVYSSHLSDIVKNTEDTRDGRSKIYKLSDLSTMKKTDTSEPVWVLAQVKNIAVNLKTKTGKTFSKVVINDGETSLTLFIWQDHLPSFFNKGNVIILPLRVVTDEDTEENKITFASWKADKVDVPILEYGE